MSPYRKSLKPVPKVKAAATGGTLAALIVVGAHALGADIPLEVAAYIEGGVLAAVGAGYAKTDAR